MKKAYKENPVIRKIVRMASALPLLEQTKTVDGMRVNNLLFNSIFTITAAVTVFD
jgi:hypothetical protein